MQSWQPHIRSAPSPRRGKIIRREEVACYKSAKQILSDAQEDAARMLHAARAEIEQRRLNGYGEGVRDGRREQARIVAEAILRRDAFCANVEREICSLVIAGIRKIFADFDDVEKTRIVVHKALSALRSQRQAVIRVNPNQYESVKQDLSHVTSLFPNLTMLTIEPDGTVPESTCVMSSELGTVTADIETQIEALEIALADSIANRQGKSTDLSTSELAFIAPFDDDDADTLLADLMNRSMNSVSLQVVKKP
jgi:type III secretion system HrpE/YscL family protein